MKRALAGTGMALLAGIAAWQGAGALQADNAAAPVSTQAPPEPGPTAAETDAGTGADTAEVSEVGAAPAATRRPAESIPRGTTPMNQRVAVIGLLNKRNGLWRDLTLKPGQAVRVGDVVVRLRACETTAPWEQQKLTGAFVQFDVVGSDSKWRRVFSGWLYKESPSLNVVEHPIYDVWPKSCAMTHPAIGPGTTTPSTGSDGGAKSSSSAPNAAPSGTPSAVSPAPVPSPTASPTPRASVSPTT